MKISKIIPVILLLSLVSLTSLSCRAEAGSSEYQTATVQRGDLTTDITGVGNLALSDKVDLAFEMDGTVEEVLVAEAESVEESQVLAKLDTSAWEDYIAGLEDKVTAAERNVTAKERVVTTAGRQIVTKKLDLLQAQVNLQTTEDNLNKVGVIAEANKVVDDAEYNLSIAQAMFQQASLSAMSTTETNFWMSQLSLAQKNLADAKKELADIKGGSSVKVTTDVATALAINQLQVEVAQGRLEDAQTAIEDAKKGVEDAKTAVEDAEKALEKARKALNEALNISPEVTAPFAGFITKVNVKGGDIVKKGAVAVVIADPNKFEAEVMVSEANISKVKVSGTASVQVEAMPGVSLSANVTHIAPTATIQSGVVNYKVKVEIAPLQSVTPAQPPATGNLSSDNITSGSQQPQGRQLPTGNITPMAPFGRAGQVFGSGNLTQEQLNQMRQQRQQAAGGQFGRDSQGLGSDNLTQAQIDQMILQRQQAQAGQPGGQQPQMPTTVSQDFQLKEGLTVTVSIIVQQKNNILLIPNAAVVTKGRQTYARVLTSSGTTEERLITVGISNWQYTEVSEGLSEGEPVIVPQNTTTTPTTPPPGGQGGMRIPGMGGFGR